MTVGITSFLKVILISFLLTGCILPDETEFVSDHFEKGKLQILLPGTNKEIVEYKIYGNTAEGRSFFRVEPSGTLSVIQDGLITGIWTIKVEAFNNSGELIFTGSAAVLVESGITSAAEIVLQDPSGVGTVNFQVEWPLDLLSNTSVVSFIEKIDGTETDNLIFAVDQLNSMAQYSGEWPAGFYTLKVSLYEKTSKVWGEAYAVQVSAGIETSHISTLAVKDLDLPPGICIWSFSAGFSLTSSIWSSAALSPSGKVYFGADTGRVYAFDVETGTHEWDYLTDDRITSSPAIGNEGTIFIGSYDENLYAINPKTGDLVWKFSTGGWVRSSPAVGDGSTVYVGSNDGYLYAINSDNGSEIWKFHTGAAVTSSPAIDKDGVVYVGSYNGNVYAIQPDGTQLWVYPTEDWVHGSPAIGTDGTVYVGSYDGFLYAINGTDGSLEWSFNTFGWIGASPVLDDERNRIYIGSRNGYLYAVDASSGTEVWSFYAGTGGVYSTPAIGDDGVLYFGSYDLNIYAVNPDGSEQWRFGTGIGGVSASPVIGSDGTIYVGSRDGNFYALASSSNAPNQSAWPMFHCNSRRTGLVD